MPALAVLAVSTPARAEGDATLAPKEDGTALGLSVAGTIAGPLLFGAGMVAAGQKSDGLAIGMYWTGTAALLLGPSAGHWYAGHYLTPGLGLRVGGAAVAVVGVAAGFGACFDQECDRGPYVAAMVLGTGAYVADVVWDLATTGDAVDAWNREHGLDVGLAPIVIGSAGGRRPGWR
ncbi:MAG: hypothetical protein H6709_10240 [Kofleriaceae bacterium]|nr:hypothetical protein [Myxococcales bacterium]MCB9564032.1 hypothetical protein [Kofleriaceae bacterium]MCB9572454.1 hypothetical protein [Kofleriaceae bacterium]